MRHFRNQPSSAVRCQRAFTLVELLVSIVIVGIISSMVAVALSGAQRHARETRAKAFIDRLNLIMLQLYEEESNRRIGLPASVWTGESASQTQLIWKRDWLRASLPASKADVDAGSGRIGAPAVFGVPFLQGDGARTLLPRAQRLQASAQYQDRIRRTLQVLSGTSLTWSVAYTRWSDTHESAECLYQIFASKTLNGEPLLNQLRVRDIADTDDDGLPEIVDPWGNPVLWMRSPVGFFLKNRWVEDETVSSQWPTVAELREITSGLGPDPIDILRGDPRLSLVDDDAPTDTIDPSGVNTNIEIDKVPFFVRPMVVSAGSDGEFDLVTTIPPAGRETISDDALSSLTAPQRVLSNGISISHPVGYTSPVYFPDPFFTLSIVDTSNSPLDGPRPLLQRPGAVTDVDSDEIDDSADNVYPSLGL